LRIGDAARRAEAGRWKGFEAAAILVAEAKVRSRGTVTELS